MSAGRPSNPPIWRIRAQRQAAERALKAAVDAERSALRALSALEAVVRDAAGVAPGSRRVAPAGERLRGARLREMIARVALRRERVGEAVHWRTWHSWLRDEGFDAVGRKPEATFLTQLSRSPPVRCTAQDGVYALDVSRFADERERMRQLHNQLAQLPPPEQLGLLGDVREQRRALQAAIARSERTLEENVRVPAHETPTCARWRRRRGS